MKIAIIITAYNCAEYILDCVYSVMQQKKFPGWDYEIRIGVDGCKKTADILKKVGIPFYWSEENHGAYIIRNSLIYQGPADVYSYFDADDVMNKDYLFETIKKINAGAKYVLCAKIQCNETLHPINFNPIIEKGGAMSFTHEVLEKLGGYYRWRCAGDTDFMERAKLAGYKITEIKKPLYARRRHPESLTKGGLTRMGSPYRKKAWSNMTAEREKGVIKIKPTVIKLKKSKKNKKNH